MARIAGAALAVFAASAAALAAAAQPTLKTAFAGFTDVNGNGVLDCGEPVEILATFATNNSGTPALNGNLYVPSAGSSGLELMAGSVEIDPDLTTGCTGTVAVGNGAGDSDARIDFFCPADPVDNNAWTLVVRYRARYVSSGPQSFTAAAQADTSDGAVYHDAVTVPAGSVCGGGGVPNQLAVAKTVAGPATPGSVLVYTVSVTDLSGLGAGGVQLVEAVPAHTTFSAAGSSPGWACLPGPGAGAVCRNQIGNVDRNATVRSFFAVTLDAALPAAPVTVANTACARLGPSVVAGCASLNTPAAGAPVLQLVKALAAGPPQTAAPGATLTYALAASNGGNQDLADVVLVETVPAVTSWSPGASSPGWSCVPASGAAGASCTLDLGALPAGGAAVGRSFAVVVANPLPPLPAGYVIENRACAHTAAAGVADACSTLGVPASGVAMLQVVKTLKSGTAAPGATLVYDLAAQNTGNEGALAVAVGETVPAHTSFAAAASSPGWSCVPASGAAGATCSLMEGALPAGATAHVLFAVAIERPLAAGVGAIANTACFQVRNIQATPRGGGAGRGGVGRGGGAGARGRGAGGPGAGGAGAGGPGEARDGQAGSCATLTTPTLGHPVISLAKTYGGGPAAAGALLMFQLRAANSGDQDAAAVTLSETVPAHTTFDAAGSSAGWSCTPAAGGAGAACGLAAGALAAGSSVSTTFAVRVDAALPAGVRSIANVACAAVAGLAPVCGQASTPAALTITGELQDSFARDILGNGLAVAGDDIAYALTVANPGGAAALDVVVATPLDPHLTLDAGTVTTTAGVVTAGNGAGDGVPVVHLASLAPGGSFTIRFTATVGALPAGLRLLSSQATLGGSNVAPTVSDDPDTPEPLDPTTTPVGAAAVQSIPTLTSWGLVALAAALAIGSARRLRVGRGGRLAAVGGGGAGDGAGGAGSSGARAAGLAWPAGEGSRGTAADAHLARDAAAAAAPGGVMLGGASVSAGEAGMGASSLAGDSSSGAAGETSRP